MSRSKVLYQLQQIDTRIDRSLQEIHEIDALLEDDDALQKAVRIEENARAELETQRRKLTIAEGQVEDQEFKIERNKKKLYGGAVTNPKELEDLQMESESLADYLKVLEDRQLEQMLVHEEANQAHQTALKNLEKIRANRQEKVRQLKKQKQLLTDQISELKVQRASLISSIKEEDYQHYESKRETSGGVAVAGMESRSCQACGSQVPSALAQQAGSPTQLAQCGTCGRILHPL